MDLSTITSFSELQSFVREWDRLSRNSIEKNIFYEPWMFLPAFRHLRTEKVTVVLVWCETKKGGKPLLTGFFPFAHRSGFRYMPVDYLKSWRHPQCFLCTPLLYKGYEQKTLKKLFAWLETSPYGNTLMELDNFTGDGPFEKHLTKFLGQTGYFTNKLNEYSRSLLYSNQPSKVYLSSFREKSLSKHMRRHRTLAKEGMRFEVLDRKGDINEWVDNFLTLEKSGWKGRRNTALACDTNNQAFFREAMTEAFKRNKLLMTSLKVRDKTAAMQCLFRSGGCGFAYKIAFDENLARFSPGAVMNFEQLKYLCDKSSLKWIDSCSIPGSSLDRLWRGRRKIKSLAVSNKQVSSRTILLLAMCMSKAASALRVIYRPVSTGTTH